MIHRMNKKEFGQKVWALLQEKHRWLKLLVLLEIILVTSFIILYFHRINNLVSYHFDSAQIASYTNEDYESCFGGTIDESYPAGLYDAIPHIFLKKGYYRYSLDYENNGSDSFSWPHSYTDYFMVMEQAVTYFEEGQGSHTDEFWLNADLDVALRVHYTGTGSVTITDFTIQETKNLANIQLFYSILALFVIDIVLALVIWQRRYGILDQTKYVFFSLLAVSIFVSYPYFLNYAFDGHDFAFHLTRLEGIKDGFLSGQFPVRINPVFYNGYGYATSIFYGELFLYVPAFLRLVGFPLTKCFNFYVIMINTITCFGSYYCFKRMFKSSTVSVFTAILYTMAPYRLMDIYIRAAVGEYTAMTFLPFVACGLYCIFAEDTDRKEYRWSFVPLVVGITGIMHSHVLTGEMVGGIIVMVCVLLVYLTLQKKRFFALCKAVFVTVGINLWFLVPFVDFALTQDIRIFYSGSEDLIQTTGAYFTQLISLFQDANWFGSKDVWNGIANEMPLTLGMPLALGMMLCLAMLFVGEQQKKQKRISFFALLVAFIVTWMATIYFPWDRVATTLPFMRRMLSSLQFIWRFLGPATAAAAVATGFGLTMLRVKEGKTVGAVAGLVLCILTVVSGMLYINQDIVSRAPIRENNLDDYNTTNTAMKGEYALRDISYDVVTQIFEPRVFNGEIEAYQKQGTNVTFTVTNAGESCYVLLPLLNYKGYHVSSDDGMITNANLSTGEAAVIRIDIPRSYAGDISVRYQGFWYWRLAEIMSAVSFALLIALRYRDRRKDRS